MQSDQHARPLDYQPIPPKPRRWHWRQLRPTRRQIAIAAVCGLVAILVWLRWPRLNDGLTLVTASAATPDRMEMDYRMAEPFEVSLQHVVDMARTVQEVKLQSRYDWLRGEHYVSFSLSRGSTLTLTAGPLQAEFKPLTTADASQAEWVGIMPGYRLGNGVGIYVSDFSPQAGPSERVVCYAKRKP